MSETYEDSESIDPMTRRSLLSRNKLAIILKDPNGGKQFCCVECPLRCSNKEALEMHLLQHSKEYRFLCDICGTGLKRKEHLDRHTLEHQEVRPHVCEECGKAFKRKEHLNIHKSIHSGNKNEICPFCSKSFYRKDHLQKHLQTHTKIFVETNLEPLSNIQISNVKSEADLEDDMSDAAENSEDIQYQVEDTSDNSYTMEDIIVQPEMDLLQIRAQAGRPFVCAICHKGFKRKDHLKLHSVTHMKKEKICSVCQKAFHTDSQLLVHMNTHFTANGFDGDADSSNMMYFEPIHIVEDPDAMSPESDMREDRPHECEVCHRKFKRKQHLKVHSNVHLKMEHAMWCSVCYQGFNSNPEFENHRCARDADATPAPIDAKKENTFPVDMDTAQEARAPTDESGIPTPQRVFVCRYCDKPFKRKDHYKIHLHIHTGVKSCYCPQCGKGFYRKDHLQKHLLVHSKSKPKPKKALPELFPIAALSKPRAAPKKQVLPEITIHAPANSKLRVPLQIKVPYQVVVSLDNGEQRAVTVDPQEQAVA